MNLSRIGFLSIFKSHVQKTKTGLWDRLECSGNHPVVYYLIKLEYLLTSYIRVCSVNKPAKTTLSHIRVTIIGKEEGRRHLEGKKKTKKNPNKQKKKKNLLLLLFFFFFTWMSQSAIIFEDRVHLLSVKHVIKSEKTEAKFLTFYRWLRL